MSADLFGYTPARQQFRDIRNTKPSVAEEKAALCLQLKRMLNTVPMSIRSASINDTRKWAHHRDMALKVLASARSSVQALESSIKQMESYK